MTVKNLFPPANPTPARIRKRTSDRALACSLLLSLALHAGAAGYLLARPGRAEFSLHLQSGYEALDLDVGAAFASAPSRAAPEAPEKRFPETPATPPAEEKPFGEELLPPQASSDLRGTAAILAEPLRERAESDPVPEQALTPSPARRYHRRRITADAPEPAATPSEARSASAASVAGASAKPRGVRQRARPAGGLTPVYPERSRRAGEEGETVIRARIDALGRCVDAAVERSSGFAALDAAALDTVRRARFLPAGEDGVPIASEDRFLIEFQLR